MQKLDIYIKDVNDEFKRVDLFKDEVVELNQNIKDFRDVSKVLSDYTQSFSIPASKSNNSLFRHYYNNDILDSFDARYKHECVLKLNGIDFKKGFVRLTDVNMKDNKAHSYKIQFFGSMASLKDIMGSDELSVLEYMDGFNHELNFNNVKKYFSYGADLTYDSNGLPNGLSDKTDNINSSSSNFPDLMYPFISAENRYYYDRGDSQDDVDKTRNLYIPNDSNKDVYHGLLYTDLKPAIKAIHVIKAIEKKYNIIFSDDFFDEDNQMFWRSLYLHCSKESGSLDKNIEETNVSFPLSDLVLESGDTELRSGDDLSYLEAETRGRSGGRADYSTSFDVSLKTDVTGTGSHRVEVIDSVTDEVYFYDELDNGDDADVDFSFGYSGRFVLGSHNGITKKANIVINVYTTGGVTQVGVKDFSIKKVVKRLDVVQPSEEVLSDYDNITPANLSNGIDFRRNFLPKIKCIDFLKSIFKMFNLIGYFEDGVIVVKPLNEFYNGGEQYDITKYMDISSHTVSRSSIFKEINYEFKKPKSVFAIKSNEATGDEYGNERFKDVDGIQFDGGKYDVKLDFGKMVYEKLIDSYDDSAINSGYWGYSVSDSFNPVVEHPLLFFAEQKKFYDGTNDWYLTDRNSSEGSVSDYNFAVSDSERYYSPSNVTDIFDFSVNTLAQFYNLNFGDELIAVSSFNDNSLFKKYHEDYILNLYQANSRTIKIKAMLPLSMILNIQMNSRLVIQGKSYIINSMKNNLETGKTELELITNNFFG